MKNIAICTLFEKDYHKGVAALVNSLVAHEFSGTVYAGYRGDCPAWAGVIELSSIGRWTDARAFQVTETCKLVFLKLDTDAHFTNIKPNFMLDLLAEDVLQLDGLFYIDPDICLVEHWDYLKAWISCGVALCEDVNSPIGEHHPRRVGWRRELAPYGHTLKYRGPEYVNGGCVGVMRSSIAFLENWKRLSDNMAEVIGGLSVAKIEGGGNFSNRGFAGCFDCSDQDALNAAIEITPQECFSILPRSAMGFYPGATILPHAVGPNKPWRANYLSRFLQGFQPGIADKAFWGYASGAISFVPAGKLRWMRTSLLLASALSRVYRKQG